MAKQLDEHDLALRAAAEHHAIAVACEAQWMDELERRRRELAADYTQLMLRVRMAA